MPLLLSLQFSVVKLQSLLSSPLKNSLTSDVELLEQLLAKGDPAPLLLALEIASPPVGLVQTTELAEN